VTIYDGCGSEFFEAFHGLEHDPEKWVPVFRKDHAQTKDRGQLYPARCSPRAAGDEVEETEGSLIRINCRALAGGARHRRFNADRKRKARLEGRADRKYFFKVSECPWLNCSCSVRLCSL
jgi:hypothetical protein